ncbi:26S proteasome regulatory subunit RPN6 [Dictyocoela muelleri]|nr:26S proteasome regulatory subunit RPN6 [Dictyocoela muelleri]
MECIKIIKSETSTNEEKEMAFYGLIQSCKSKDEILEYCKNLSELWKGISMSRMSKIFKKLIYKIDRSFVLDVLDGLISFETKKMVLLALEEQRILFLLKFGQYSKALELISKLISDFKQYDDKSGLINMYMCESKAYYALRNKERSKSSLVTARALAVNAYCTVELQSEIDMMSGMHICDERKYDTANGYFLEALDGLSLKKHPLSVVAARYTLLSKILGNKIDGLSNILVNKNIKPHLTDPICQKLLEIKESCKKRDLKSYDEILKKNRDLLAADEFLNSHLHYLYDILINSNLKKIIEPYKNIPIKQISDKMGFDEKFIESRLRIMILDGEIDGVINHVKRTLILNDPLKNNECRERCLEIIKILYDHIKNK